MIHGQTKTQHFLEVPDSKTRHGEETFYGCSYLQDKVSMLLKGSATHVQNIIINHCIIGLFSVRQLSLK